MTSSDNNDTAPNGTPTRAEEAKELRGKTMKKRWMKSVVETSLQATPDLPFSRRVRHAARMTPQQRVRQFA